jgi:peptide/nickel transport system ATP-binding protein
MSLSAKPSMPDDACAVPTDTTRRTDPSAALGTSPTPALGTNPTPAPETNPTAALGTNPSPALGTSSAARPGTHHATATATSPSIASGSDPAAVAAAGVPLLEVRDLRVTLPTARGPVQVLRDVSFSMARGQTLGIIGESGCGKSMTALALMGLLPEGAQVSGSIRLNGQELTTLDERALCALRGARIGMVFQEPMTALNPLHTIGRQIAEPLRLHRGLSAAAARAEALRLLERVRLPQAAQRLDAWPHQLSGGQRQRVVIAIALACGPDLLVADEPTTALDVTIQREVLDLIGELVAADGMGLVLISHDLGVMAQTVRRLLVMYAGSVVESGPTAAVFRHLAHPYTRGLFAARPRLGLARGTRLATIPGRVPDLAELPSGCAFAGRCPIAENACSAAVPPLVGVGPGHHARCIKAVHAP